ncbi:uncharacterized protein LOC143446396 [Clavelina lepadiformis]|uniref:uncharacterized protein LOC143446396 n=1 Tax=Clavelina lepadiformis TaxID=159417 RepID=UPI0040417AF3
MPLHPDEIGLHRSNEDEMFHFGIFGHPADGSIKKRLEKKLTSYNYGVCLYNDYIGGGLSIGEKCFNFLQSCHCFLWIASPDSLADTGYLKYYRNAGLHSSIECSMMHGCNNFVAIVPEEFKDLPPNQIIPKELQMYEPVKEDDVFEKRMRFLLERVCASTSRTFLSSPDNLKPSLGNRKTKDTSFSQQQEINPTALHGETVPQRMSPLGQDDLERKLVEE